MAPRTRAVTAHAFDKVPGQFTARPQPILELVLSNLQADIPSRQTDIAVGRSPLPQETWVVAHDKLRHIPRMRMVFDALVSSLQERVQA